MSGGEPTRVQLCCSHCGYDLSDQRATRCPECGSDTSGYFVRRPPSIIVGFFAVVQGLFFIAGSVYFAVNPGDLEIFEEPIHSSVIFVLIFLIFGLGSVAAAVLLPQRPFWRFVWAGLMLIAAIVLMFSTIGALTTVHFTGDILLFTGTFLAGSICASSCGVLIHRLLHREQILHWVHPVPDAKVAILGAGQLGRMLGQAGVSLGVRCRFLDASRDCPAAAVGDVVHEGFTIGPHLDCFAEGAAVVTYEFENVPVEVAAHLARTHDVRPSPRSLEIAQDRLRERELFQKLDIPTPAWQAVDSLEALAGVLDTLTLPVILKTRRMGYDGKGQARITAPGDAGGAWDAIGRVPAIADEMVAFVREISVIVVRGLDGEVRCYPPVENEHRGGILRRSLAPAPGITPEHTRELEQSAGAIASALDHVGVLAVEFFELQDGTLLANEFAPRVHNSGHWTIEGAETSQFENHLRAILGLPLGSTGARGHSAMLNIVGDWPDREALLRIPGLHLHDYDKQPRPGRKIGHVTLAEPDIDRLHEKLERVERLIGAG